MTAGATHDLADPTDDAGRPATRRAAHRRPRRGPVTFVVDSLMAVLSFAGVLCVIAVACAFLFDISLIMFKTGSMTPTIPTGSLAIVRELPASEVHVGDVTTIDRPDELPVTHRITAIEPTPDGHYSIRMKGDANPSEDAEPYVVDHVRKVLWSTSGAGYLVARLQNPRIMATTTIVMALLVTWAFWPREERSR